MSLHLIMMFKTSLFFYFTGYVLFIDFISLFTPVYLEGLPIFLNGVLVSILYLIFTSLYFFGLFGLLFNLKNLLISLLMVELTYFGIIGYALSLAITFSLFYGYIIALLVILIAAAESVVGLGLVIIVSRYQQSITFDGLVCLAV